MLYLAATYFHYAALKGGEVFPLDTVLIAKARVPGALAGTGEDQFRGSGGGRLFLFFCERLNIREFVPLG